MLTMEAPPKPASPVERAVAALLVENTGSNMLDSGGAYGRAWQRTRVEFGLDGGLPNSAWHGGPGHLPEEPKDDDIERVALAMREGPEGSIDLFGTIYVDTFHFLVNRLDYDPALDRKFRRFVDKLWAAHKADRIDWPHEPGAIERFIEQLREHGAGIETNYSCNTYNGEDELDRTLQYDVFTVANPVEWGDGWRSIDTHSVLGPVIDRPRPEFLPDGVYVALQIHGGADVRGGYTDAHLFTMSEWSDLTDNDRFIVWCDGADVVTDQQAPGQITIEAEVLEPTHVSHCWDNTYGDGLARRYDSEVGDQVDEILILPYSDRDREGIEDGKVKVGYPPHEKLFGANVASYDDEAKVWRCPFDQSPLHVSGEIVG